MCLIFIDQKVFEVDFCIIFDRFSSIKCLSFTKNLVNAKLLVVVQLLADGILLEVSKHLEDSHLLCVSHQLKW